MVNSQAPFVKALKLSCLRHFAVYISLRGGRYESLVKSDGGL